jgi:hypothetical protein
VSCSLKATSPGTCSWPCAAVIWTKSFSPWLSVVRNDSSSATHTALIRSACAASSGYWGAIAAIEVSASAPKTGSCAPSKRIERTVRRMIRRRT